MLSILYEDNHCLAVCKPAGLATQAPPGLPSLEALARAYLEAKYAKAGRVYLGVPHRLDRPVSGVVLFARQTKSARRLAEQFRERQVKKVYWAVLERSAAGEPPPEAGSWEDWLLKVPGQARVETCAADAPGAKSASLSYVRLSLHDEDALVELKPITGRTHQIRVQAAARGWPVRGDALYGARLAFAPDAVALHGRSLTFLHPIRYDPVEVTAEPPEAWARWVPARKEGPVSGV